MQIYDVTNKIGSYDFCFFSKSNKKRQHFMLPFEVLLFVIF